MIGILGSEKSGKRTLLRYIAGLATPAKGSVLTPAHMRAIFVDMLNIENANVLSASDNVIFAAAGENADMQRARRICTRLDLCRDLDDQQFQEALSDDYDAS